MKLEKEMGNAFHKSVVWMVDSCSFIDSVWDYLYEQLPADVVEDNDDKLVELFKEIQKKLLTFSETLV